MENKFHYFVSTLLVAMVLTLFANSALAQKQEKSVMPLQVTAGIYVLNIRNLNFDNSSFRTTFWLWFLQPSNEVNLEKTVEIVNTDKFRINFPYILKLDENTFLHEARYSAKVYTRFDLSHYPFDTQKLHIYLEDTQKNIGELRYAADKLNSALDPGVEIDGWKIKGFSINSQPKSYETNFGDYRAKNAPTYSRLVVTILLQRKGLRAFVQMFSIFYFSLFLLLSGYLLAPNELKIKASIMIGSILSLIASKYNIDLTLTRSSHIMLVDKIEFLILFSICYSVVIFLLSNNFWQKGKKELACKFESVNGVMLFLFVLITNLFFIYKAMH